jgi:hypothetical protein
MMSKSENGWDVIKDQSDKKLIVVRLAKSDIPLRLHKDAAKLLAYVAVRFDKEVSPLRLNNKPGFQDDGGYSFRKIENSIKFSNHASGTAIDLNWQKFPMFRRNMTKKQVEACRAIVESCEGLVRWGGEYRTNVDQMHFEVASKVTAEQIKKFVSRKRIKADGSVPIGGSNLPQHIKDLNGGRG